jgi:hypothetical protein
VSRVCVCVKIGPPAQDIGTVVHLVVAEANETQPISEETTVRSKKADALAAFRALRSPIMRASDTQMNTQRRKARRLISMPALLSQEIKETNTAAHVKSRDGLAPAKAAHVKSRDGLGPAEAQRSRRRITLTLSRG